MQVIVNGEAREVDAGAVLADLAPPRSGVAAAVNDEVVRRGEYAATRLGEGDRVEIVMAVQGG